MKQIVRWPTLLVLVILIVAAIVPTALSIRHAIGAHASGGASITLSSSSAQPGATIQVSGKGFTPSQSVTLYLGTASGGVLTSATTDASGNLPLTNVTVPDQPGGAYSITAVQGKLTVQAPFSIVPVISLSRTVFYPGALVTLTAKGFAANTAVELYFDTISGQSDMYFDSNSNGGATIQLTLPPYFLLTGGHHVLIAVGASPGVPLIAQVSITISPYISPMAGQPGIKEYLYGVGFVANEPVSIYWGKATGQLLGSTTAGASGYLSFAFTVPAGLSAGLYPMTVVCTQYNRFITTYLRINPLTLTITPGGIHSGQQVQVQLTGFLANETVTLSWNADGGEQLFGFNTNKQGSVSGTFTPGLASPGTYTVTASDSQGLQATSTLSIGPGISKAYGDPGTTVTISGGGFAANETVNVYLQTPKNGEVTTVTNTIGAFWVNLTLPSSYDPSTHYFVYAVSTTGTDHASAPFKFLAPTFTACDYAYTCGEIPYGQTVDFSGTNFATNETVDIIWNYQQPEQFTLAKTQCFFNVFNAQKSVPSVHGQGTVTIAAIGETSHLIVTTTLIIDAAIYDNLYTASAGASMSVNGGGFGAGDAITLSLSGKTVATTTSASDGTFATTFRVPAISGAGNLTLTATDAAANVTVSLPFYYTPTIVVSPNVVQNGDTVAVTGMHFSANAQVQVFVGSDPYFKADANGRFSGTVTLSGYQPGSYLLAVEDWTSYIQVSAPIVVQ
jgi:hypothetical protein